MTGYTVVAASRAFYTGREQGMAVPGPDEDSFTLGVAAGELLEPRWTSDRPATPLAIWVSGDLSPSSAEDLPLALGLAASSVLALPESGTLPEHPREFPGPGGAVWIHVGALGAHPPGCATALLLSPGAGTVGDRSSGGSVLELINLMDQTRSTPVGSEPRTVPTRFGEWDLGDAPRSTPSAGEPATVGPALDAVSQGAYLSWPTYREGLAARWRFVAERCANCGHQTFPARGRCERCGEHAKLERVELARDGASVEAITTVHAGAQPTEFDFQVDSSGSYDVALLRPAPGVLVTVQVTDSLPGALRIGDRVETCLRRLYPMEGRWRYGRKARPKRSAPKSG